MLDVGRAVEIVPLAKRHFLTLDDQQALAAQDEESLLVALAVIHRHRLTRSQDRQIDAETVEPLSVLVELASRAKLVLLPSQLATFATNQSFVRSTIICPTSSAFWPRKMRDAQSGRLTFACAGGHAVKALVVFVAVTGSAVALTACGDRNPASQSTIHHQLTPPRYRACEAVTISRSKVHLPTYAHDVSCALARAVATRCYARSCFGEFALSYGGTGDLSFPEPPLYRPLGSSATGGSVDHRRTTRPNSSDRIGMATVCVSPRESHPLAATRRILRTRR